MFDIVHEEEDVKMPGKVKIKNVFLLYLMQHLEHFLKNIFQLLFPLPNTPTN